MSVTRRQFLTYLGLGNYAALTSARTTPAAPQFPLPRRRSPPPKFFQPIVPSNADSVIVPDGFRGDVLVRWADPLRSTAPDGTPERFGFNNDFNAYFPIDAAATEVGYGDA